MRNAWLRMKKRFRQRGNNDTKLAGALSCATSACYYWDYLSLLRKMETKSSGSRNNKPVAAFLYTSACYWRIPLFACPPSQAGNHALTTESGMSSFCHTIWSLIRAENLSILAISYILHDDKVSQPRFILALYSSPVLHLLSSWWTSRATKSSVLSVLHMMHYRY